MQIFVPLTFRMWQLSFSWLPEYEDCHSPDLQYIQIVTLLILRIFRLALPWLSEYTDCHTPNSQNMQISILLTIGIERLPVFLVSANEYIHSLTFRINRTLHSQMCAPPEYWKWNSAHLQSTRKVKLNTF